MYMWYFLQIFSWYTTKIIELIKGYFNPFISLNIISPQLIVFFYIFCCRKEAKIEVSVKEQSVK